MVFRVLVAAIVIYLNRMPQLLTNYTTTWPLKTFYAVLFISLIFITALYLAAAVLLLGLAWFFLDRVFGPGRIAAWIGGRAEYYRDALLVAVFGTAALLGLGRLPALFARWPVLRHVLPPVVPDGLDTISPGAATIATGIVWGVIAAGMVGLAIGLIAAYVRPWWMRLGLSILVAALTVTDAATTRAFLHDAVFYLVAIVALGLGITRIVRFNALGYFLLAVMMILVPGAADLLGQPNAYFHANGYAVLLFALGLLAWPLLLWRRSNSVV